MLRSKTKLTKNKTTRTESTQNVWTRLFCLWSAGLCSLWMYVCVCVFFGLSFIHILCVCEKVHSRHSVSLITVERRTYVQVTCDFHLKVYGEMEDMNGINACVWLIDTWLLLILSANHWHSCNHKNMRLFLCSHLCFFFSSPYPFCTFHIQHQRVGYLMSSYIDTKTTLYPCAQFM